MLCLPNTFPCFPSLFFYYVSSYIRLPAHISHLILSFKSAQFLSDLLSLSFQEEAAVLSGAMLDWEGLKATFYLLVIEKKKKKKTRFEHSAVLFQTTCTDPEAKMFVLCPHWVSLVM